jgi:phosphatidylserine decarboxylase
MTIHKEGYKIIFFSMLILAVANIVTFKFTPDLLANIFLIISLVFFILVVQFFRNPKRNTIINDKHIIAPADGKVVVIEDVLEDEYFHEKMNYFTLVHRLLL